MPFRFRGKNRIVPKPTMKDLIKLRKQFEREERNMLILRHPYITVEQSHGHMKELRDPNKSIATNAYLGRNKKFTRKITIADRLNHLNVTNSWD
ncbi:hypothetical protein KM043_008513 [Ampulex compressa]|nr:hypothetical protein KM043_008513 [Ampulex compressa]